MSDARTFLARHTAEVEPLTCDYGMKYWVASLTGSPEDAARSAEAKEKLLRVYARPDEYAEVRRLEAAGGHDPQTARQLKVLRLEYAARQMDPEVLADIARREEEIEQAFNSFRAVMDGTPASENEIRERLRDERDVPRRQAAWEASKQIGASIHDRLMELVRLRNREARRLGHRDYYAMSLEQQELDEADLFGLLGQLKTLSDEPFGRVKAALDASLARRYGLADWNSAPWLYADPFFQEAPPGSADIDLDGLFVDQDIEALTRRTYEPLDLPVESIFQRSDLYERAGKCQHAFCTHIDRAGDVRVLCNIRPGEYWMSTMLHEFGHAVYDQYLDPTLPFLLRGPAHISTTEGVAMLFGRLTRDPAWLSRVAGLPEAEARRLEAEFRRALMISQLIFVRWGLLFVHFEREIYRDPERDLNRLWWTMAGEFQGVRAPADRHAPDWASKIHFSGAPVYYQNYILGELTASQLEAALRNQQRRRGGAAGSWIEDPASGRFLREKLFALGARYDWQETLREATGERLNPAHYLNQFVQAS